MIYCSIEEIKT